jgi:plasmid maintenance system antidote protein VapI
MAAITNQPEQQGVWARLGFTWEGVAEHRPVSGLTVWLLKLAAISSALVLFFAAVIIGISVTDPAAIAPQGGLMHFANMAMSFGVDGALPGIFFTAVESWQQDRRGRSTWLFSLVIFMLVTAFVSYCVSGQPYEANFAHPLLVAKCMVAILYVMSVAHQVRQDGLNPTQVVTLENRLNIQHNEQAQLIHALQKKIDTLVNAPVNTSVNTETAQLIQALEQRIDTPVERFGPWDMSSGLKSAQGTGFTFSEYNAQEPSAAPAPLPLVKREEKPVTSHRKPVERKGKEKRGSKALNTTERMEQAIAEKPDIGIRELARVAGVTPGTASSFLKKRETVSA